ncbi:MAG: hypothetical protein V4685_07055 [Bacteroidota bacterium]
MKNQSTLRQLFILHKALLFGQIMFAAIGLFLQYTNRLNFNLSHLDQVLQVVVLIFSAAGVFIGASLFKKKIQQAKDTLTDVKAKAEVYRSASIIQWALIEAPSLFCIICFMLAGNYAFLALAAALMLWFALTGPAKLKIMILLGLNETEMENF